MATLNQFLEKALVNEGDLVGDKLDEKEDGPGKFNVYMNLEFMFKAKNMEDAMGIAQDAATDIEKKYKKLMAGVEMDQVEGPK